ncbi:hypothetical protein CERSUDRAFT_158065 [Gelatoporia subvermispora B]|uniref:C2H2-type domain-containing protein n=1 Tax=Ceriporiopsis subvermispora (strain B) TaxID=914234 RepID=M2R8Y4_CERS8|nr:hypothetical protein CERSUDRAFT_158065 [Gelatoporia subvermispora B]
MQGQGHGQTSQIQSQGHGQSHGQSQIQSQSQSHGQSQGQGQEEDEPGASILADLTGGGGGAGFGGLSRALTHGERELLAHLERLKFFLATAPARWSASTLSQPLPSHSQPLPSHSQPLAPHSQPLAHDAHAHAHPALNRFLLPNAEYVSCVLWGGLYHITGTDIVRALVFRFEAFGRPVRNMKKFEEGVFSDLRNLKPGVDACLEEPKSPFLDLLFKYQCIRTQKKQKVFYWFSVPHDRLFLDALERDLKREKMGLESTTVVVGEPALSFTYDPKRSLYEQFCRAQGVADGEGELEAAVRRADEDAAATEESSADECQEDRKPRARQPRGAASPFFAMFSLFEGSPTYKQRRKKVGKGVRRSPGPGAPDEFAYGPARAAEPQVDRFGRDTSRLSAADMFLAQARGDFGAQSNADLAASQKERQRHAMELAGRQKMPFVPGASRAGSALVQEMRYAPPGMMMPGPATTTATAMAATQPGAGGQQHVYHQMQDRARAPVEQRHNTYPIMNGFAQHPQHPQHTQQQHQQLRANTHPYGAGDMGIQPGWAAPDDGALARTKAFVCPLFSCGRMFKRMEHLKRHLRTHTLERPFQCARCKKRFSRSDNLNQHLRTHARADAGAGADSAPESEADEADDGFAAMQDVEMCAVEVQGVVHDVPGDEEGLVVTNGQVQPALAATPPAIDGLDDAQDVFYGDSIAQLVRGSPEQSPYLAAAAAAASPDMGWGAARAQVSPAFAPASMPNPRMLASYHGSSEYVTSISAPSHKLTFDHASLYPPDLNMNGPGPIRRHRSATPSISKYGETIRRPFSAAVSDQPPAGRAYHPYALAGHHPGVSQSADSSPAAFSVPLGYDAGPPEQRPGMHSRSSSSGGLQEQMHQMLNLEQLEPEALAYAHDPAAAAQAQALSEMYRTDSPMQYPAPAHDAYELELARQSGAQMSMNGMYAMMPDAQAAQYGTHALHAHAGFYAPMQGEPHPVSM